MSITQYQLDQQRANQQEIISYQILKVVRWLLQQAVSFIKVIFTAIFDAIKMFIRF